MSKEITIPVPDGKRAEWINGVLTLVDEPKEDNRPVTERIKTLKMPAMRWAMSIRLSHNIVLLLPHTKVTP